ncbi:MAG: hypothetical protein AAF646_01765 [Pseudomonadota bacterium]
MAQVRPSLLSRIGLRCRAVAVALLSGWLTGRDYGEVEARLATRSLKEQTAIVGATLTGLFLLALLAAQAGVVGLALYGIAVVIVAR